MAKGNLSYLNAAHQHLKRVEKNQANSIKSALVHVDKSLTEPLFLGFASAKSADRPVNITKKGTANEISGTHTPHPTFCDGGANLHLLEGNF